MWQTITEQNRESFNKVVTHPLQSYEWGEFRKATGIEVIRKGWFENNKLIDAFQLTLHKIPHTSWNIGYLPKGNMPTPELLEELKRIGKEHNCIFIQLEPNVREDTRYKIQDISKKTKSNTLISNIQYPISLVPAAHPLFTQYTLELDLTQTEEQLLANMHQKARYNIKVARKHGVTVEEKNTAEDFKVFWKLTEETTSRQQFYAHTKFYHQTQWQTLPHEIHANKLSSHLLIARYQNQPLTAWIVFVFKDMLYYPYGASSHQYRETMHSTQMMWEAIRFGKKHHLKAFDLWGSAAPGTPESDPWFGFTQFKERFGPARIKFVGSYDLVIHPLLYQVYKIADKLRWMLLKLR